jgi:excisionase family DNA binding protein
MRRKYLANGKPEGCEGYRTVAELAEYVGFNVRTIERWAAAGRIPAPERTSRQGWKLWSPTQAIEVLEFAARKRRIR